jgi:hypothetical protein
MLVNFKYGAVFDDGSDRILRNSVEVTEWSQSTLFDDLIQLGDNEAQELRQMLEAEQ